MGKEVNISKAGFLVVTWLGFAIATVLTVARLWIRRTRLGRWFWDDAFHVLAWALLLATNSYYTSSSTLIFQVARVTSGEVGLSLLFLTKQAPIYVLSQFVLTLTFWATIWSVKLAFLLFYRRFFISLKWLTVAWWVVLVIIVLAFGAVLAEFFIVCGSPQQYFTVGACLTQRSILRTKTSIILSTSLDIITDVMIMALPLRLLWALKINKQQKLAVASCFSLAVIVIIFSIVRAVKTVSTLTPSAITSLQNANPIDLCLYSVLEATVAVIVSCLPSFRVLFVVPHRHGLDEVEEGKGSIPLVDSQTGRQTGGSRRSSAYKPSTGTHLSDRAHGIHEASEKYNQGRPMGRWRSKFSVDLSPDQTSAGGESDQTLVAGIAIPEPTRTPMTPWVNSVDGRRLSAALAETLELDEPPFPTSPRSAMRSPVQEQRGTNGWAVPTMEAPLSQERATSPTPRVELIEIRRPSTAASAGGRAAVEAPPTLHGRRPSAPLGRRSTSDSINNASPRSSFRRNISNSVTRGASLSSITSSGLPREAGIGQVRRPSLVNVRASGDTSHRRPSLRTSVSSTEAHSRHPSMPIISSNWETPVEWETRPASPDYRNGRHRSPSIPLLAASSSMRDRPLVIEEHARRSSLILPPPPILSNPSNTSAASVSASAVSSEPSETQQQQQQQHQQYTPTPLRPMPPVPLSPTRSQQQPPKSPTIAGSLFSSSSSVISERAVEDRVLALLGPEPEMGPNKPLPRAPDRSGSHIDLPSL